MARIEKLHLVGHPERPTAGAPDLGDDGDLGDLVLTATIFGISLLPLVGAVVHAGHFGQGELGLGTAGSLFAGRELWSCARAALRARRHP